MELIIISSSKLKIMLTAPDMQHYELQGNSLSCVDEGTRRAFRHIFDDARAQAGFDTEGERLFIQLYTSRDGGCEIFVTKLGENETKDAPQDIESAPLALIPSSALTPSEEALLRRVMAYDSDIKDSEAYQTYGAIDGYMDTHIGIPISLPQELHTVIVTVAELPALLSVCRRLLTVGYDGESHAYIAEDELHTTYHLLIDVPDGGFYLLSDVYAFLREYGDVKDLGDAELYLSEHGKLLCGHQAVDILGKL